MWKRIAIITFILLVLTFLYSESCDAQAVEKKEVKCDHESNSWKRFHDNMRITPAVRVLNWDGREMSVMHMDKEGIHPLTLIADKDSSIHLETLYKQGLYIILYCEKDLHIYAVYKKEFR